jgi:DNA-binding NtrC family response regulator
VKRQILAIDDEPHMLQLLERIVAEKTPFELTATPSSLDVPRLLDEREFDLIITDLRMPGLDGLDIVRLVKEADRLEEVVVITAFGSLESAAAAVQAGAIDYLSKPFKKEQILLTIDRAMQRVALKRELRRLQALFRVEPFDQALPAIRAEYVRMVAGRAGSDVHLIAERTGLSREIVAAALRDE